MCRVYGALPKDLGPIKVEIPEVMYYLYLPIKLAGHEGITLPKSLKPLSELLLAVQLDVVDSGRRNWHEQYVYVTVKKMFVGNGVTPNRPGWHADGFGTDDLNYIWYDSVPTLFNTSVFDVSSDHVESLAQFEKQARDVNNVEFPCGNLLRLDPCVVHRVGDTPVDQVMRTFVKVSVSKDKYNLKDNSINHELGYKWRLHDRAVIRNDPTMAQRDSVPEDDHFK